MSELAYTRRGEGEPLVLVHPLGSSRQVWEPVFPELARHFDVLAVDLPGFGGSEPLPPGVEATPAALARSVGALLDELGVRSPHVVGNSLGGWVALEMAGSRVVSSLTLLSPAGLWRGETPRYCRVSLRATRWLARHAARPLAGLVRFRLGRLLVLGQTHGRPGAVSPEVAREAIRTLGTSSGFDAALAATLHRHYRSTGPIAAPVTVAFGSRDVLLLRRQSRWLRELPAHTRLLSLPGCGHIPLSDDPAAVVRTIRLTAEETRRRRDSGRRGIAA
jgi:pimeloyl-ACP methyl ester carboxylesterase